MFTNRLFNLIVAAVFMVVVVLVAQQAFASKAVAPETDNVYSESKEDALRAYQLGERYGVMPQQDARNKSYRSPLDECFDVPLREVASCRNASQVPVPSYRSPLDVCSDVGLIYRAQCLSESQKSTP